MTEAGSERHDGAAPSDGPRTAGALLRAAREREGLHLAVLAATIKVTPAKLQALEQDRHADLPNATFTRALAQSVCRSLKIDPRPVLALLPQVETPPLESSMGRLNTPFHERPNRTDGYGSSLATKPLFIGGAVLLIAAVAVALVPRDLIERWRGLESSATGASAAAGLAVAPVSGAASSVVAAAAEGASAVGQLAGAVASAASALVEATPVAAGASVPAGASAASVPMASPGAVAAPAAVSASGVLRMAASGDSWVEVTDAHGQVVFSRIVKAGEQLGVDGALPLRVRVGNAAVTTLSFKGQALDLATATRDNVARLELR